MHGVFQTQRANEQRFKNVLDVLNPRTLMSTSIIIFISLFMITSRETPPQMLNKARRRRI